MSFRAALMIAALTTTVATACTTTESASTTASAAEPVAVTTIDGATVSVPQAKPTAVFFFSVNCGGCVEGMREFGKAADHIGAKASFLAVDMDPSEPKNLITSFLDDVDAEDIAAAIDTGAALSQRFKVPALSTLIVITPDGEVVYRATEPSAEQIVAALEKAGV